MSICNVPMLFVWHLRMRADVTAAALSIVRTERDFMSVPRLTLLVAHFRGQFVPSAGTAARRAGIAASRSFHPCYEEDAEAARGLRLMFARATCVATAASIRTGLATSSSNGSR